MSRNPLVLGMITIFVCSTFVPAFVSASRDAILPQGDPGRHNSDAADQGRREEIRKNRLKQQGQGEQYRIEGNRQGASSRSTQNQSSGRDHRDTGLADPTVNPGQAAGMRSIRGKIIKSENKIHTVRQKSGPDIVLIVDDYMRGDTELHLGDHVIGTLTEQGRAVLVKKKPPFER